MSREARDPAPDNSEGPQHKASLASFALGQTEVTLGEFRAFITATGYQTVAEQRKNCWFDWTWRTSALNVWLIVPFGRNV